MATKECKRQARELVQALEVRVHAGPPVGETDIQSARDFLRQHDFSTASDYFSRLALIKNRVGTRPTTAQCEKRNYGGKAAGHWMQLQSVYDHVILSTCYEGDFNTRRGRIKISHRFNQAGRIDFVELKFLRSLQPDLDGAIRKLLLVQDYRNRPNDWYEAEAFALRVLPRELVFVFGEVFRSTREEVLAWLVNIGHWSAENLLNDLRKRPYNGGLRDSENNPNQLGLEAILSDKVALPILEQAEELESTVDLDAPEAVIVRYDRK
jgi:hypothetical protein